MSALIWEASENYSYARSTPDGRIVMGGEDDDTIVEPEARDALMPVKGGGGYAPSCTLCGRRRQRLRSLSGEALLGRPVMACH